MIPPSDGEIFEAVGTSEGVDAVDLARQNANYGLRQLEDEGRVESKKVGR